MGRYAVVRNVRWHRVPGIQREANKNKDWKWYHGCQEGCPKTVGIRQSWQMSSGSIQAVSIKKAKRVFQWWASILFVSTDYSRDFGHWHMVPKSKTRREETFINAENNVSRWGSEHQQKANQPCYKKTSNLKVKGQWGSSHRYNANQWPQKHAINPEL